MAVWFITFHGGGNPADQPSSSAPSSDCTVNSLMGLILSGPLPPMRELRGFTFDEQGNLYIANGYKKLNQILQFEPTGTGTYTSALNNPWASDGLNHPFDLEFDSSGNLYVTNQDLAKNAKSLQVTLYNSAGTYQGVFIPSTTASTHGPDLLQLRGISWDGDNTWYVADEQGGEKGTGAVYLYDNEANYKGAVAVSDPVHLLFQKGYLFIGSGTESTVYYYNPSSSASTAAELLTKVNSSLTIKDVSGIAIPGDGYLYVGNRLKSQILQFPLTMSPTPTATGGVVFFDELPDFPEFIGLIPA